MAQVEAIVQQDLKKRKKRNDIDYDNRSPSIGKLREMFPNIPTAVRTS
jgi:hypothetical protein